MNTLIHNNLERALWSQAAVVFHATEDLRHSRGETHLRKAEE